MPPTGKKLGGGIARQRSRNTTPSTSSVAAAAAAHGATGSGSARAATPLPVAALPGITRHKLQNIEFALELLERDITYDDLVDASPGSSATIPDFRAVDGILGRLKELQRLSELHGRFYDRGMRLLSQDRRHRLEQAAADERARDGDGGDGDGTAQKRANKKKRKQPGGDVDTKPVPDAMDVDEEEDVKEKDVKEDVKDVKDKNVKDVKEDVKDKDVKDDDDDDDDDDDESSDEDAPPPRPVPQLQTFGEDPSTFPDPTVYEIRAVTPGMSVDEIKEIYSVASYPKSDLADLIAGPPPDKDFTTAKPSNQINFSTFATYIEPYFRPFTEEDLAFLRERGDRVAPFAMPKRGKRHYTEIWAEEDGAMALDGDTKPLPPNQPRGTIDAMTDDVGETDKLSVGPLLARLMAAMRPEHRPPEMTGGPDGDAVMSVDFGDGPSVVPEPDRGPPPAAYMPESASDAWRKAAHPRLEYAQVDERIKQELRHIGFLPLLGVSGGAASANGANGASSGPGKSSASTQAGSADAALADYDGHYDDEIAARLRRLQAGLREQMLVNGARKARLAELVKERMAYQEYQTILEDLDSQVNGAYLKRTRTLGKSKKGKRPGGAGGGTGAAAAAAAAAAGTARPGIGDVTRTLMERRKRWMDNIGTVFDDEQMRRVPRAADPGSSIFQPDEMAALVKKEKEAWDDEVDDE